MFDHEKLDAYRLSIEFVAWVSAFLDELARAARPSAVKHLDEASTSVASTSLKATASVRCRIAFHSSRSRAVPLSNARHAWTYWSSARSWIAKPQLPEKPRSFVSLARSRS